MNNMTEKEKYDYLIEKGFIANKSGEIISKLGRSIGSNENGYVTFNFRINQKKYNVRNHRFIWYFFYKEIPNVIDHINQDRNDNRIENLRNVTHQQNTFNTKCKGYSWNKKSKKWLSRIVVDSKNIHLGRFDTENEAREAYLKAKQIYHTI